MTTQWATISSRLCGSEENCGGQELPAKGVFIIMASLVKKYTQ